MKSEILIIGAGLTGLLLAYKLKKKGVSIRVVEARDRIGGRIHTLLSNNETPIEMGATWFNAQHQELLTLLEELELPIFKQFMQGIALFESTPNTPPQQIQLPSDQQASYRIQGGTATLIHTLAEFLDPEELSIDQKITHINHLNDHYEVLTENNAYCSKLIVSTLPPRLLINTIQCTPPLPSDIVKIASKTHTWMGESIKFGVAFSKAFWREKGFSGTAFSNIGPITELYDHSNIENSSFALKGFLQNDMFRYTKEERKSKVLAQLLRLFGEDILEYITYEETVWKEELYTSIDAKEFIFPNQNNGHPIYLNGLFNNTFFIGGSETSPQFGGYMEGAVRSAMDIYNKIN